MGRKKKKTFWEVVGLERGPLSLVWIIEELLERKMAAPVYKTEINGRGNFFCEKKYCKCKKMPRQCPSGLL
jgi:hypothetical protein